MPVRRRRPCPVPRLFRRARVWRIDIDIPLADPSRVAPAAFPAAAAAPHAVLYYDDDEHLIDRLTGYFVGAFDTGEAAVVIATQGHRDALSSRLAERGIDVATASGDGYVALDAAETLAAFMVDGWPDATRFAEVIDGALSRARAGGRYPRIRVFGEMVALLWLDGKRDAALRLEQLWNDLISRQPVALLCAYPIEAFAERDLAVRFQEITGAHVRVTPTETYTRLADAEQRLREVAELQQKAIALETESEERKAAARALRQREAELADFLENAVEGLHRVGADGTILWANRAELEMLGYTPDEYIGHQFSEFHVDRDVAEAILRRLVAGETLYDQPARLRCKDGSIRHVRIHSNAYLEDGVFVYSRCFTRDVTQQKLLEDELRQRIAQLHEFDRRKDEFLAMLGHELRNPLAPITTALQLMRLHDEDGRVSRSREIIERQIDRMTRLVDDLLDVSRITRGKIELRHDAVALAHVVERAVETARPLIDERAHRLSIELPNEPVRLLADPARLEQIISNLLHNAAKYTDMGGHIWLSARVDGAHAVLSVKDDGAGLDEDLREHVFDLFVQGTEAWARSRGGLGIGLTLVRRLVELHGGTVTALSEGPGKGSEFVVRLPLEPFGVSPTGRALGPVALGGLPPMRILIVDDNVDAAEALADLLREFGQLVETAHDGASALDRATRTRPDFVLLDLGMPEVDGYEVARRLRAEPGLAATRLVALTGYGEERHRRLTRQAGFDHHLTKPVDMRDLERLLKLAAR